MGIRGIGDRGIILPFNLRNMRNLRIPLSVSMVHSFLHLHIMPRNEHGIRVP